MNQKTIADLLRESAQIGREAEWNEGTARANRIQVWLGDEVIDKRFEPLLDSLYVDTRQHNPAYLPLLLPLFAMLCGNLHDGKTIVSNVDWEHFDREVERFFHAWQKSKESETG